MDKNQEDLSPLGDKIKDSRIEIRLTLEEKERVILRSNSMNLSVSEYAREILLKGKIEKLDLGNKKLLVGIGNNLNQIARHMNSAGLNTENSKSAIALIEALLTKI
ncbi:plasmid mobilization protein [Sphingobacterium rhinopitheci]|uniref:plasmid mobilization protein n=1 Tax=Sphingobacterium rhinopitheci TaxID=2781960 RepID=UPI001F518B6D|nr:plasmid mobilization relaxosome protein MobC [Sphingobacterium rhinopitheci]MCI0922738.1 plasmid mobilization relaxosome protein MobC [Sphingobacterium rhinopitheci]